MNKDTRPNFFIVGAPKCGTTAWVDYLGDHPDICFSNGKEPHYFNTDLPGFRWATSIDEYLDFFQDCNSERIIGEASVQYLYSTDAAKNIAKFAPNAKILIFLRSPGAFIRSYHNQLLLNRDEDVADLRRAWENSGKRNGASLPKGCREARLLDYKRVGLFSEQVQRYVDNFPRRNVKIIFFEDWIVNPRYFYLDILDFLGIEDDGREDFKQIHGAKTVVSWKLHSFTQRPPRIAKVILAMIRRIPGLGTLKPAKIIRALNVRSGYSLNKDQKLEKEIDLYFSEDQKSLKALLYGK